MRAPFKCRHVADMAILARDEVSGAQATAHLHFGTGPVEDIAMRPALPLILSFALVTPSLAQDCARDAMLVLDGSASMAELGFDVTAPTRMEEARLALDRAMPRIAPVRRLGLLVYGPGGADGCSGVDLRFAPRPDAAAAVVGEVAQVVPGGLTPLAGSVDGAVDVLGDDGIVVLVTDGNETCGGRPCALGARLAEARPGITVHVIGFRVVVDPFSWNSPEAEGYDGKTVARCLPDATGGRYVDTQTVDELAEALEQVLGCAVIGLKAMRAGSLG